MHTLVHTHTATSCHSAKQAQEEKNNATDILRKILLSGLHFVRCTKELEEDGFVKKKKKKVH